MEAPVRPCGPDGTPAATAYAAKPNAAAINASTQGASLLETPIRLRGSDRFALINARMIVLQVQSIFSNAVLWYSDP